MDAAATPTRQVFSTRKGWYLPLFGGVALVLAIGGVVAAATVGVAAGVVLLLGASLLGVATWMLVAPVLVVTSDEVVVRNPFASTPVPRADVAALVVRDEGGRRGARVELRRRGAEPLPVVGLAFTGARPEVVERCARALAVPVVDG